MQLLRLSKAFALLRGGLSGNGDAAPVFYLHALNNSGGALARGDVVVLDPTNCTANMLYVTTSTGGNDINVLGMVYDTSIASLAVGRIQTWGPTKYLKVDGTTDIAIGDRLGTFTTAKIAQKSTTGGRFAIALEAYTTNDSAGVIDAFITVGFQMGAFTTE